MHHCRVKDGQQERYIGENLLSFCLSDHLLNACQYASLLLHQGKNGMIILILYAAVYRNMLYKATAMPMYVYKLISLVVCTLYNLDDRRDQYL